MNPRTTIPPAMEPQTLDWIRILLQAPVQVFTIAAFVWLVDRMNRRYLAAILQKEIDRNAQ